MSALYVLKFLGALGAGGAVLYIGKGKVFGMDANEHRYEGSYTENGGRVHGTINLVSSGRPLVTGQPAPPGTRIPIKFDWSTDFATGQVHQVVVGVSSAVQVSVEKLGDIPSA